jgi:soluble lytic murein transglycosylase-like protein
MAVMSVFIGPIPAEAKREDIMIARSGASKLKSGLKLKAKQPIVRRMTQRRKAVLGGKPVAANAAGKAARPITNRSSKPAKALATNADGKAARPIANRSPKPVKPLATNAAGKAARPITNRSPKPVKPLSAKAVPKRLTVGKTAALGLSLKPRAAAAKPAERISTPPKPPKALALKVDVKVPSVSNAVFAKPALAPRAKEIARPSGGDGLPPFIRASSDRFEQARRTEAAEMIIAMAPCQQVPVWLALRVAMTESSLNREARGSVGEIGLFQLKCETARLLGFEGSCERLYDARTNIHWGLKHLARALEFSDGDPRHAASKHNGGLGSKELRPAYVQQVMCSSARSGFPSAYQLGASWDIQRMCAKTQSASNVGPYGSKDLLTSSFAEIGVKSVAMVRTGVPPLADKGCNLRKAEQPDTLPPQTGAKPQQVSPKPPSGSKTIEIIGSLAPAYIR